MDKDTELAFIFMVLIVFWVVSFFTVFDVAPQNLMEECEENKRYERCGWVALPMTEVVKIIEAGEQIKQQTKGK